MIKLKYETGVATFIQFIVMSILNFVEQVISVVSACINQSNDCVSNSVSSISLVILAIIWFGFVWMVGFTAQDRRSRRLAKLLILGEIGIIGVEVFNIKHPSGLFGAVVSLVDIILAVWVITLAWRILKAKGGRVVISQRARKRRPHTED